MNKAEHFNSFISDSCFIIIYIIEKAAPDYLSGNMEKNIPCYVMHSLHITNFFYSAKILEFYIYFQLKL